MTLRELNELAARNRLPDDKPILIIMEDWSGYIDFEPTDIAWGELQRKTLRLHVKEFRKRAKP